MTAMMRPKDWTKFKGMPKKEVASHLGVSLPEADLFLYDEDEHAANNISAHQFGHEQIRDAVGKCSRYCTAEEVRFYKQLWLILQQATDKDM